MFETAMVETGSPVKRALSVSGSLAMQGMAVGGLVIAGLLVPVAMPETPDLRISVPAPQLPKAVRVVAVSTATQAFANSFAVARRVYAPTRIPDRVASVVDLNEGLPMPAVIGNGVPTGVGVPVGLGDGTLVPLKPTAEAPKPKPVVETPQRIAIGGQVLASKILERPQPIYPPLARQARIEGTVILHGVIGRDGRINQLNVVSGHPLLTKAALDAVQRWRYTPTTLNGQPVEVEAPIEVRFRLSQ